MTTIHLRTTLSVLVAAVSSFGFISASAQELDIKALHVAINGEKGGYQYIDARMDETAAAASLFGVAGAVINSGINNSQDSALAERFQEQADSIDVAAAVEGAVISTLKTAGITLTEAEKKASHRLVVEMGDWGLRRRDGESRDMRAYVNVRMILRDKRGREIERDVINRVGKLTTDDLAAFDDGVFAEEVQEAAHAAGQQIAYDIIYR